MITTTDAWAVERLLRRVLSRPERYRRLLVVVPFLDEPSSTLLQQAAARASRNGCCVTIVTRSAAASLLRRGLRAAGAKATVIARDRLHAKVYIAEAHIAAESESIITSANLTMPGLRRNSELGVSATPTSAPGRRLYDETFRRVRREYEIEATPRRVS